MYQSVIHFVLSLPKDFRLMMFEAAAFGWDIIGIFGLIKSGINITFLV